MDRAYPLVEVQQLVPGVRTWQAFAHLHLLSMP